MAGKAWYVLVCQQDQGIQGRHRPVLRTRVLLVPICGMLRHQMSGPVLSCPNLPRATRAQTGPVLSCLARHCLTLPFPSLSGSADHDHSADHLAQSCPVLTDPSWPHPFLFGPVRYCPALSYPARTYLALPGSAQSIRAQPCPTLSGLVRFVQIIIIAVFLVCNALCESKIL